MEERGPEGLLYDKKMEVRDGERNRSMCVP